MIFPGHRLKMSLNDSTKRYRSAIKRSNDWRINKILIYLYAYFSCDVISHCHFYGRACTIQAHICVAVHNTTINKATRNNGNGIYILESLRTDQWCVILTQTNARYKKLTFTFIFDCNKIYWIVCCVCVWCVNRFRGLKTVGRVWVFK